MRDYEITIIVDPVLSGEDIKATAQTYVDQLTNAGCEIVYVDEMGLRTLAYTINKRNSGVYYTIEFRAPNGEMIDDVELALRRDERIMRFLTVKLDKFGVQYNQDKRDGKIAKAKKPKKKESGRDRDKKTTHPPSRKKADAPSVDNAPSGDASASKAPAGSNDDNKEPVVAEEKKEEKKEEKA